MNELLTDPRFALGLVTLLWGLTAVLARGYVTRLERLEALERDSAKKSDLTDLREDLQRDHSQNTKNLEDIRNAITEGLTRTHERIDDIYRDLLKEKE